LAQAGFKLTGDLQRQHRDEQVGFGPLGPAQEDRANVQEGRFHGAEVAFDLLPIAIARVHRRGVRDSHGDIRFQEKAAVQQGIVSGWVNVLRSPCTPYFPQFGMRCEHHATASRALVHFDQTPSAAWAWVESEGNARVLNEGYRPWVSVWLVDSPGDASRRTRSLMAPGHCHLATAQGLEGVGFDTELADERVIHCDDEEDHQADEGRNQADQQHMGA
jgi:hypothetical protein